MKTRQSRRQTAKVSHSRWLAYATASAATALAGSHSAEAAIHYSGRLEVRFPSHEDIIRTFQLDQPGDSIVFTHYQNNNAAYLRIFGIASAGFRGGRGFYYDVSRLSFGQNISAGGFAGSTLGYHGLMAFGTFGRWIARGIGYVGFRFNNGAGFQYGWARVRMGGPGRNNGFELLDYAYADPGEPITAGQRSSDEQAPDQGSTDEQAPDEGSLGGLALGAAGLLAWRKSRSRAAR